MQQQTLICENPQHDQQIYAWCKKHEVEVCPECLIDFHQECVNQVTKIRLEKEDRNKKLNEQKQKIDNLLLQEEQCSQYLIENDLADLKTRIKIEQQENIEKLNQQSIEIQNKLNEFKLNLESKKKEIENRQNENKNQIIKDFAKDKCESLQQYQPFYTLLKFQNFDLTNFKNVINDIQAAQKTIEKETSDQRLAKINQFYEENKINDVQLEKDISELLPPFPQEQLNAQWQIDVNNKNIKLSQEGHLVSKVGKSFKYMSSWLDLIVEDEKVNVLFEIIDPGSEEEIFGDLFIGLLSTDGWKQNFNECLNGHKDAKIWAINKNGFYYRPIQEQIIFPQKEQDQRLKRQGESDNETVAEGEENKVDMQNEVQEQENANANENENVPSTLKTEMLNDKAEFIKFTKGDLIEIIVDMTNEKNRKAWIQKKGQQGVEFENLDQKVIPYICMGGINQEVLFVEATKILGRKSKFSLQNGFLSQLNKQNQEAEERKSEDNPK